MSHHLHIVVIDLAKADEFLVRTPGVWLAAQHVWLCAPVDR
jgi:hypothetical protein